jgi:P-type Cu+ transporter
MSDEKVKDPVCGMTIEKSSADGPAEYQGRQYYFCSPGCLKKFEQEPEKYATSEQEGAS